MQFQHSKQNTSEREGEKEGKEEKGDKDLFYQNKGWYMGCAK